MRQLAAPELKSVLAASSGAVTLLDVREPWEYELCRIEGSRHIPLRELARRLGELDPMRPTVVICHHGVRSLHAAVFLKQSGFAQIANLEGGIDGWARRVDPAMAVY